VEEEIRDDNPRLCIPPILVMKEKLVAYCLKGRTNNDIANNTDLRFMPMKKCFPKNGDEEKGGTSTEGQNLRPSLERLIKEGFFLQQTVRVKTDACEGRLSNCSSQSKRVSESDGVYPCLWTEGQIFIPI